MSWYSDQMAEKLGKLMSQYDESLAKYFDESHWREFSNGFQHDFWTTHIERTAGYDKIFVHKLTGKKVLEIGGFPGLLLSAYLHRGAIPTAIDHPSYHPPYYENFLKRHGIRNVVHDINLGAPPEITDEHFDVAVMSDVLLHNNGMPLEFIQWLKTHVDEFYLINYRGDGQIVQATRADMYAGHTIASPELMAEYIGNEVLSEFHPSVGRVIQYFVFNKSAIDPLVHTISKV